MNYSKHSKHSSVYLQIKLLITRYNVMLPGCY